MEIVGMGMSYLCGNDRATITHSKFPSCIFLHELFRPFSLLASTLRTVRWSGTFAQSYSMNEQSVLESGDVL